MANIVEHRNFFLVESSVPEIDELANAKLLQGTLTINKTDGFTRFVCDDLSLEVFPIARHWKNTMQNRKDRAGEYKIITIISHQEIGNLRFMK